MSGASGVTLWVPLRQLIEVLTAKGYILVENSVILCALTPPPTGGNRLVFPAGFAELPGALVHHVLNLEPLNADDVMDEALRRP